jgi:hypothetical protein
VPQHEAQPSRAKILLGLGNHRAFGNPFGLDPLAHPGAGTVSTRLGKEFKLKGNKIVKDEAAIEAKLDVSTRIQRRSSKKVRAVKPNR